MKGKRHRTEHKILILRGANSSKGNGEVCRKRNISEVTRPTQLNPLIAPWTNTPRDRKGESGHHVLRADRALRSQDVLEWLNKAIEEHGAPQYLRSDNGPEFIAKGVQRWLAQNQIRTIYVDSGSPWQNGFVESFHGRFRDECLNREQLWTLTEARVVVEDFRCCYNHIRPHSKLGYESPARYAKQQLTPSSTPVGLRPPWVEDGQTHHARLNQANSPSD